MDQAPGPPSAVPFHIRPGTNDEAIYNSVVTKNEYRVPERFARGAVVIDIGVHVGSFSYLALTRGAAEVYGFEVESANYACALRNLAPFGDRMHLSNRAVWRSDILPSALHFCASGDPANAGGGSVIWDTDGPLVEPVAFDEVIRLVGRSVGNKPNRTIDLVKIDCEGAEFPILLTSALLGQIESIVGEYHELRAQPPTHARVDGYREYSLEVLVGALERAGFGVEWERQATGPYGDRGLFFAARPRPSLRTRWRTAIAHWLGAR